LRSSLGEIVAQPLPKMASAATNPPPNSRRLSRAGAVPMSVSSLREIIPRGRKAFYGRRREAIENRIDAEPMRSARRGGADDGSIEC
jgi:hypothetical protein